MKIMINSKIKTYLDRLVNSPQRPGSYLFVGANEGEKEEAVFYFISKIVDKFGDEAFLERVKSKNHPDIVIVEPEIEEKKGKTREKEISIGQIREALERLKYFPYESEKKFCVIKKAERMNAEASNALLKNLEEPTESAIYVLLANDAESLLPTIVSRCAVLRFPQTKLPAWDEDNREQLKIIFKAEIFERFDYIEKISKNRNEIISVLKDWESVGAGSLRKLIKGGYDQRKIKKVVEFLECTRESINRLEYTNASARGVGEGLVLNF